MGRTPKEINWKKVEEYIEAGSSGTEIAAKFDMKHQTFYARFAQEYECGFQEYRTDRQEGGAADLRWMIHAKALNNKAPGNPNVLMYLASRRLGMKEPENTQILAVNQNHIDQRHYIMQLEHQIQKFKDEDGIRRQSSEANSGGREYNIHPIQSSSQSDNSQSEAEQELLRSDP